MANCVKCGKPLLQGVNFCGYCGAPVVKEPVHKRFCVNCGAELSESMIFCHNCGYKAPDPVKKHMSENMVSYENEPYIHGERNVYQDGSVDATSRISLAWDSKSIVILKSDGSIWTDSPDIQKQIGDIKGITAIGHAGRVTILFQKDGCLVHDPIFKESLSALKNDGWKNVRDIIPMISVKVSDMYRRARYVGITQEGRIVFPPNIYDGALTWISDKWKNIRKIVYISGYGVTSEYSTDVAAGLCTNGDVLLSSSVLWQEAADWKNMIDICSAFYGPFGARGGTAGMLVGLRQDGTVMAACDRNFDYAVDKTPLDKIPDDIREWQNISSLVSGYTYVAGLRQDGTIVMVSMNSFHGESVKYWRDIIAIAGDEWHLVGLCQNGRVVAAGSDYDMEYGTCNVESWNNIVAIAAEHRRIAGVKKDGTVIYTRVTLKDVKTGFLKSEKVVEALPQKTTPVSIFS